LELSPKAVYFWKSGFKFAFGRKKKKGKVCGILSQLKKPSKYNAQDKTFLAVRNKLL